MSKKNLPMLKKECYLCFEFTIGEFTEEQIKTCAEHWMDAKNCPNWKPVDVFIIKGKRRKLKEIIWVDVNG